MHRQTLISKTKITKTPVEYIDDYSDSVCCEINDILMTRTGNTGIVITGVEGVFHNNFFKINFDTQLYNKDYLVYYLNKPETKKIILARAGISTIPDLNHKDFYSIPIPIPPLPEQTAIANALRDIDDLINTTQALIAKKKDIKTATMQQLLTPKENWVEMRLGDVGDVKMCKRIFSHQTLPYGEIPFYKSGTFGKEPDAFITRQKFDTFKSKFSYPNIGDILISAAGTIGRTVIYNGDEAYFQDSNIVWIENDIRRY